MVRRTVCVVVTVVSSLFLFGYLWEMSYVNTHSQTQESHPEPTISASAIEPKVETIAQPHNKIIHERLEKCHWPPPLYPHESKTPKRVLDILAKLQDFVYEHRNDVFIRLEGGGALGMYREGRLLSDDSDIDIHFYIRGPNKNLYDKVLEFKRYLPKLSFNDLRKWGDFWSPTHIVNTRKQAIKLLNDSILTRQSEACLPDRSTPLQSFRKIREYIEIAYGDFWFIRRVPFKRMQYDQFGKWRDPKGSWHFTWVALMKVIDTIDSNHDSVVTESEIDAHVEKDGIDMLEYREQISERSRCRAAKLLTWFKDFDSKPFKIPEGPGGELSYVHNGGHPLFRFPECEKKYNERDI